MPAIQPNLLIPATYQARIDAGELFRDGGVLRRTINGTIALILKDAPAADVDSRAIQTAANTAIKKLDVGSFIKSHKKTATVTILGLAIAIGTSIYLYVDSKKKNDKAIEEASRKVHNFQNALTKYLQLAMKGALHLDDIDRLLSSLDELECGSDGERIVIDVSSGELSELVSCIIGYTKALATANSYELDETYSDESCSIISLRHHLQAQKKIFESVT